MDQADTLRNLLGQPALCLQPVIGDAGRPEASLLAAALAEEAALEGFGGLVIDGSRDVLVESLGLKKRYELAHYLSGDVNEEQVVLSWGQNRRLLPATRGIQQLGAGQVLYRRRFSDLFARTLGAGDDVYLSLSHAQAGIALSLCGNAPAWVWLVEPSRTSVTECYKAMSQTGPRCGNIVHRVMVSRAQRASQADDVFAELQAATRHLFAQPLEYAGQYRGAACARALRARHRIEAII